MASSDSSAIFTGAYLWVSILGLPKVSHDQPKSQRGLQRDICDGPICGAFILDSLKYHVTALKV